MHPITQRLPIHPPNARRGLTAHAVPDRGQREQATRLVGITTCCSSLPKLLGTHPLFERNRHHAPRPRISRITADGITAEDPGESSPPDSKRRSLRVSLFAGWYQLFTGTGPPRIGGPYSSSRSSRWPPAAPYRST